MPQSPATTQPTNTNPLLVTLAWLVVILPSLWGLSYTVKNALKLFTVQPAATSPSAR